MTVTAERIAFLTCWSDDALAMMANEGYRDDSDNLLTATLEELEAVKEHRAEREREWIRSLTPAERSAYVESGELTPHEVAVAMGVPTLAKIQAKPAATRPALVAHDEAGNVVNVGDAVKSFRGEAGTLVSLNRPKSQGRSGKVSVKWDDNGSQHEYYDKVFGLTVSEAK